ncbi:MAG: hypothetical protein VB035_14460 [Candidatus Fimivivens sp.]|nr:hypothetical protein [Candidatus Fimivivens sp.]
MKRAAFEIKQSATGNYYFTFKNPPEQANIISCSFPDRAELEKCLARVREAAPLADICIGKCPYGGPPYFWIQPKEDGVRFSLVGFKGEIIFSSVPYPDELHCNKAINLLKSCAQRAGTVDLTVE